MNKKWDSVGAKHRDDTKCLLEKFVFCANFHKVLVKRWVEASRQVGINTTNLLTQHNCCVILLMVVYFTLVKGGTIDENKYWTFCRR